MRQGKITWKLLKPWERGLISNGCGGKGSWIDPPDWLFRASCDWHDFEYWRGGTEADRAHADLGFYTAMLEDAESTPWWYPKFLAKTRAWIYYKAVRRFGKPFFHYGEQRGWEDLKAIKNSLGH